MCEVGATYKKSRVQRFSRLSYLAVNEFWNVVETRRNRSEIDRNRLVPVCPGVFGLVSSGLGADVPHIDDVRADS